ncbi:MAG: MBOAT family protein [Lachnospiraceae bacterium]|nr:MBOAT family protein [Lachnospiraceae bacterium]
MSFTSYGFIGIICLLTVVYYLIPKQFQWWLLLIASYALYLRAGHGYVYFLLATTIITYLSGVGMKSTRFSKNSQKAVFVLGLLMDLGLLIVMKYTNFLVENLNGILSALHATGRISYFDLILPLGISFYTFMAIGYLMDVRGEKYEPQSNPFRLALFLSFFPAISQGPISRYDELSKTLYGNHTFAWERMKEALLRILWGYFKKLVIADRVAVGLQTMVAAPGDYRGGYVVLAMIFFALQLYADFTGGIDITIGIAKLFGVELVENFDAPYASKSVKEYWRRWHMTMGTWFRDYLMYPLLRAGWMEKIREGVKKKWGKKASKRFTTNLATIIVWLATGIWHGASWNRVLWGLLNCFFIVASVECEPIYSRLDEKTGYRKRKWYPVLAIARTLVVMSVLRMFECFPKAGETLMLLGSLFTTWNYGEVCTIGWLSLGLSKVDYVILAVGVMIVWTVSLCKARGITMKVVSKRSYGLSLGLVMALVIMVLVFGTYGHGYDASAFIYNQF